MAAGGALVRAARQDAREDERAERQATRLLAFELEETLAEVAECVGKRIAVLDAEGNARAGLEGRVHKVIPAKGLVVLNVTRNRRHGHARDEEYKTWRVQYDESFVELD